MLVSNFSWPFIPLKSVGAFKIMLERRHLEALSGKDSLARFRPKLIALYRSVVS